MDPKKFRQLVKLDEHRQLCQQSADSGLGRSHSDIRQSNMSNVSISSAEWNKLETPKESFDLDPQSKSDNNSGSVCSDVCLTVLVHLFCQKLAKVCLSHELQSVDYYDLVMFLGTLQSPTRTVFEHALSMKRESESYPDARLCFRIGALIQANSDKLIKHFNRELHVETMGLFASALTSSSFDDSHIRNTFENEYRFLEHYCNTESLSPMEMTCMLASLEMIISNHLPDVESTLREEFHRMKAFIRSDVPKPEEPAYHLRRKQHLIQVLDIPENIMEHSVCSVDLIEYLDLSNLRSCRLQNDFRQMCSSVLAELDECLKNETTPEEKLKCSCEIAIETKKYDEYRYCCYLGARFEICNFLNKLSASDLHISESSLAQMSQMNCPVMIWNVMKVNCNLTDGIRHIDTDIIHRFVKETLNKKEIQYVKFYICDEVNVPFDGLDNTLPSLLLGDNLLTHARSSSTARRKQTILVVLGNTVRKIPPLRRICNIPVCFFWEVEGNKENESINKYLNKVSHNHENLPGISSEDADRLFKSHRNLNMIASSPIISVGFSSKTHRFLARPCIVLYCDKKGMIPKGDTQFPNEINGTPTDVREGFCKFASDISLQIGSSVTREPGGTQYGTIGGFVDVPGGFKAAITCAHALYTIQDLGKGRYLQTGQTVAISNGEPCFGRIIKALFHVNSSNETSIDAALVQLNADVDISGHFPNVHKIQLSEAGFTELPSFHSGKVDSKFPSMQRNHLVVKFGIASGLTSSQVRLNSMHARVYHDSLSFETHGNDMNWRQEFMLFNQYEVHSSTRQPFCEPGDSGSFVFNVTENSELECIGMVIGRSSSGSCIMTPIKEVLKAFNLPETLTSFETPSSSQRTETDSSSSQTQLMSTLQTLTHMIAAQQQQGQELTQMVATQGKESATERKKIHEDIKLMDARVSAVEDSMQKITSSKTAID